MQQQRHISAKCQNLDSKIKLYWAIAASDVQYVMKNDANSKKQTPN